MSISLAHKRLVLLSVFVACCVFAATGIGVIGSAKTGVSMFLPPVALTTTNTDAVLTDANMNRPDDPRDIESGNLLFSPLTSFTNSGAITIPAAPSAIANKPASPYPSNITVSGLTGSILSVTVTLNGFHHTQQKDVDAMLVAPNGVGYVFMSDLGGSITTPSPIDLTFDDSAATAAPNTAITASGTYKPANYIQTNDGTPTTDIFDSPAPAFSSAAPTGTATFTTQYGGITPNGTWSLYIMDDTGGDSGALDGGWSINITTSVTAVATTTVVSSSLNPSLTSQSPVFTATVVKSSDSSAVTSGTVTFVDQTTGTTLASNVALNGSGQASSGAVAGLTERRHTIVATFNATASFLGSNGSIVQTVDFATTNPTSGMWCNTNSITVPEFPASPGTAIQYPSHISVSGQSGNISHLVVSLKNVSHTSPTDLDVLLVGPGGQKIIILSDSGGGNSASASNITLNIDDTSGNVVPATGGWGTNGTTISTKPVDYAVGDIFPAPAPAGPYGEPVATGGAVTLDGLFGGQSPNGTWSLYVFDDVGGDAGTIAGGWCLSFATTSDPPTTTTVTSSLNPSNSGQSVTITATVLKTSDNSPVTTGTVSFLDGVTPLVGPLALNGSGQASYTTSAFTIGTHPIIVNYSGVAGTFGSSNGTVNQTVDAPTTNPTYGTYCNASNIGIPLLGIANPYASNINIPNFPGTLNKVTVQLKTLSHTSPTDIDVLLVGPAGQKVLLLSDVGGATPISNQDLTFDDAAAGNVPTPIVTGTYKPTDINTGADSFPAPAPAPPYGSVLSGFSNTLPSGAWHLYVVDDAGGDQGSIAGGWCVNLVANAITGTGTTAHIGPAPSNHMRQGGTGSVTFSLLNNGSGSTGDPDQAVAHAMTVTGTLPAGLTLGTVPTGTPWNCTANTTTTFTCTNLGSIAEGSTYQLLTIPVNVASNAPSSVIVSGVTFSGAGMTAGTFASDTITIDPAPILSISKTHSGTFTQSSTAAWNLQVTNTSATAAGATDGSTITLTDALPAGWTLISTATGVGWNCNSSTATSVICTSTSVVAGAGGAFPAITVNVNVPANAAVSTSNTAKVFGGGDLTHTNSGNAATSTDSVTVIQVPATIQLTSGNNQTVAVNTAFPTNPSVTVLDAGNVAISGATVTFTAPASGASGTFAGGTNVKSSVSNASGVATATVYTSNATAGGPYSIGVAAGAATNNFSETNVAGTATQMTTNTGTTPQSAAINTTFANALGVTVKDASNNPVSGVTVTFTAPGSGASGTFSNSTATIGVITNSLGVATALFTANSTAGGPYTVTAAASALTTVNFSLTNTLPNINYNTTGSTLSCNGVAGCVQNTTTSVTIGGTTFTYNTGSGSNVKTPSIINYGNIVTTGTGTNVNATGLLLTINVNSTPPGAGGTLPNGAISGSVSTSNSGMTILFNPNNTTTSFGTLPGVVMSLGGNNYTYQVLNPSLGLQSPTVGNPIGQTTIQGAVTVTSGPIPSEEMGASVEPSDPAISSGAALVPGSGLSEPLSSAEEVANSAEAVSAGTVNYNTSGSTLSCNGVAGCVQNTSTSVTIGGMTFTYNSGSGSGVLTPSIINLGNVVTTGTGTNISVSGLLLTINVNSAPPGASGTLPNGSYSGTVSTNQSLMTISFGANNTTTPFGTLPGVIVAGGGQSYTYQILNPSLGLQAPTIGNPIGQTSIQGAVTNSSPASMTANAGTTPQSATINTVFANAPAVTVLDAANNPVSGVNVTFTAPGSGASGVFSNGTATITVPTNSLGVASATFTANGTAGGPYNVSAAASGLTTVNFSLTNTPGAPSSMTANVGTTPQSTQFSTAFANALAVTVKDGSNNPIPGVNVTFTAPGSGASGLFSNSTTTITVVTNSSGVASATFTANSTVGGPYNVTATSSPLAPVNFSLTDTGGPATHFAISAPSTATAGVTFSFTVTALDAANNVASGYSGTVHFTSTTEAPTLPANTMLVNGVGTLGATLYTAGIQTISAYDLVNNSIAGMSNNITVGPGTAYSLKITAPANVTAGAAFSFTVTGVDAYGNTGALGTGNIHFTSTDGSATLPADTQLVNGAGTFNATLRTVNIQTISAADVSLAISGISNNINVGAGTPIKSRGDFDGDGLTDVGVFRPSDGNWYVNRSTAGFTSAHLGISTDMIVPGDYDGDGKADYAIWRPTVTDNVADFYVMSSSTFTLRGFAWGVPGDVPVVGDYDGDGVADVAIYRPSTGVWWILKSQTQTVASFQFGAVGDVPMVMDFNGDGKTDLAVYRASDRNWYMALASGTPAQNYTNVQWGLSTDILVPADYDGDNKDDIAVFRPSDGTWYIMRSTDGGITQIQFGLNGDIPLPGDYDGDGKDDLAVFRPSTGTWFILRSTAGFAAQTFGTNGDKPIPAAYHP